MELRRFHRVKCMSPGELIHHDITYRCRLENVSLKGALISADECIMVPLGETCTFSLNLQPGAPPLIITVTVVHCFFSMIGVKFVGFTGDAEQRLLALLKETTPEPVKLVEEWELIQRERADREEELEAFPAAAAS